MVCGQVFPERAGAEVIIAEDGQQAIDAAVKAQNDGEPFELVLMDMQMPVMNGRDAVQNLRSMGFDIPIIALTADAMEGQREECLEIGCNEYCPKPIDGPALIRVVHHQLLHHREKETT
ncbi:MAG: response regulator [Planctomycetaceae bacterium]